MDWEKVFLETLRASRPAYDEPPVWQSALGLYEGLSPAEAGLLDATLLKMIDEDYLNPHSARETRPFDDVSVNLPAGMTGDDLLCIEAAVLVAAERQLAPAFFAFNRLMRAPRWHALFPKLYWLNYEGFDAQRRLAGTEAGRFHGALLGMAVAGSLQPAPDGGAELGPTAPEVEAALELGRNLAQGATPPLPAGESYLLAAAVPLALSRKNLAASPGPAARTLDAARSAVADVVTGLPVSWPQAPGVPDLAQSLEAAGSFAEALTPLPGEAGVRALAGGIAGARFGPFGIPRKWTTAFPERGRIEELAEKLYAEAHQ